MDQGTFPSHEEQISIKSVKKPYFKGFLKGQKNEKYGCIHPIYTHLTRTKNNKAIRMISSRFYLLEINYIQLIVKQVSDN